jgi:signal transduction histidine kinase
MVDHTYSNHRYAQLLEVCRNLSSHLELEPLLNAIIESASELTSSESSFILAFDAKQDGLKFIAAPWFLLEKMKTVNVSMDNSVAGWVYANNQPYTISNAERDDPFHQITDRELGPVTYSILVVPMAFKGKVVGVLQSVNKANGSRYNEEDVLILETLASQAALAVENRRLLDEAQQAYQKAMELDRMKSDFMAIASHELRTPLGVILGHATFLQETVNQEERDELEIIVRSAMRLKDIIEDFSNIDHIEHGLSRVRRRPVIMQQIMQEACDAFRNLAMERKIKLVAALSQKQLVIDADAGKVAVVLRELIKNALSFTNSGGQVLVKCDPVPGFVKVTVTDTGIGIPPEEQEKIFQRFYQVEKHLTRKHGGMGLGLSIVKDIVEMHGGKVWVESIDGKGSRFSFVLPLNTTRSDAAEVVFSK